MSFLPILTTVLGVGMSLGYLTQTIKIFRTKSAKDVSLITYLIFGIGISTWLIYGLSIKNYPIILTNIVALIGAISVIVSYFQYKH